MGETLFPAARARLEQERAEVEAANADRLRRAEIDALLRDRAVLLAQREKAAAAAGDRKLSKRLVARPDPSVPAPGLLVVEEGVGTQRELLCEQIRKVDAQLEAIDRELAARGWSP